MNSGSASKSLELLEKTYGLPMTNQYKNWLDDKVPVPVTLSCGVAGFHPQRTPLRAF